MQFSPALNLATDTAAERWIVCVLVVTLKSCFEG